MTPNERARKRADERAYKLFQMWQGSGDQGGQSYAALSRSLNLSRERVRIIVQRGKQVAEQKARGSVPSGKKTGRTVLDKLRGPLARAS